MTLPRPRRCDISGSAWLGHNVSPSTLSTDGQSSAGRMPLSLSSQSSAGKDGNLHSNPLLITAIPKGEWGQRGLLCQSPRGKHSCPNHSLQNPLGNAIPSFQTAQAARGPVWMGLAGEQGACSAGGDRLMLRVAALHSGWIPAAQAMPRLGTELCPSPGAGGTGPSSSSWGGHRARTALTVPRTPGHG